MQLMGAQEIAQILDSLTAAIVKERVDQPLLVGIRRRGIPLAERLAARLLKAGDAQPEVGSLDITFYRDDLSHIAPNPQIGVTNLPFSVDDRIVYLVDDVLFTGRTIRAALNALLEYGRPSRVILVVLIDRGHRELPIQADIVGKQIETQPTDNVEVRLKEVDGDDSVVIERGGPHG